MNQATPTTPATPRIPEPDRLLRLAAFGGALCLPLAWLGAEAPVPSVVSLDAFTVVGSSEAAFEMPGSAQYLDATELRRFDYGDITKVLRQTPGVSVREEDGWGNFPNISMRGVDNNRSGKVTVMEDGILTAPAPYSAPAAYYTPSVGRMEAIEILKGSSQIRFGPHTTGGVINYRSTSVPEEPLLRTRLSLGNHGTRQAHVYGGGFWTREGVGRVGVLLEGFHRRSDGFKRLDSTAAFSGSGADTGFERSDSLLKLVWQPAWDNPNTFEFKVGYLDFDADETYLGLATSDFRASADRRYAASRFDTINTYGHRLHLRHTVQLAPESTLANTVYAGHFHRNWYKLHELRGPNVTLARALFPGTASYNVLTGQAAGTLRVRANNRDYRLYGWQTDFTHRLDHASLVHDLEAGLRFHADSEHRFQHNDDYTQNAAGAITALTRGVPGSQDNRKETTRAAALYLQDRMSWGDWTLTPGLRMERLWYRSENYLANTRRVAASNVYAPGVSVEKRLHPSLKAFGGIHRGYSTPGPGAVTGSGATRESSESFEAGLRYRSAGTFRAELIAFHTRMRNLLVNESIAGGLAVTENIGRVRTQGLEASVSWDPARAQGLGYGVPLSAALTWTDARLVGNTTSQNPESIFAGGRDGHRLPYVPEWQWRLGAGLEWERWSLHSALTLVNSSWASAANSDSETVPVGAAAGTPDARFGKIDGFTLVDLSLHYDWRESCRLFASVNNVFEERYMATRLPHGPRPGAPRLFSVGVDMRF